MTEKAKHFLTEFISAVQAAKIYTTSHPKFKDFVDRVLTSLKEAFQDNAEVVIGIVEGELAVGQEIFFELSQKMSSLISYLQEKGVERIVFLRALEETEVVQFISYLITRGEEEADAQESLSRLGIRNIRIGKITVAPPVKGETELEPDEDGKKRRVIDYTKMYTDGVTTITQSLETVMNEEELDYVELRYNMLNFMENLMGKYQNILNITSIRRKDLLTFNHILNVSILAMFISSKLGYSKDDILDIGTAALFHDIGKLYVSQKILKKKGKLDEEEFRRIKHHTLLGTEMLFKYVDAMGILPVVVAVEHHLRYDMKGYPKLSFARKPHPASLIVSLCDVYDALAQRRAYKRDFPPLKIYNIMINEKGGLFDPQLLDKFFEIMGVWPRGTIVALSDGRIAVVREVNERDIFSPTVEVISPEQQKEILDLEEKKEELKIKGALNPFTEGKKYLELI
ncbi:MAG: HD domain-containing protein [Candidatus Aminicenantes bacterium]|nr:HD domain-containing protein [Candidatus Aminicenantes bacterium]